MGLRLLILLALLGTPAAAHRLVVYAYAEDGEIVVEAAFDSGRPAQVGTVVVRGGDGAPLAEVPLGRDGEVRLPIPAGAEGGVRVEVFTGEGHDDYWLLSPADLGAGG